MVTTRKLFGQYLAYIHFSEYTRLRTCALESKEIIIDKVSLPEE